MRFVMRMVVSYEVVVSRSATLNKKLLKFSSLRGGTTKQSFMSLLFLERLLRRLKKPSRNDDFRVVFERFTAGFSMELREIPVR